MTEKAEDRQCTYCEKLFVLDDMSFVYDATTARGVCVPCYGSAVIDTLRRKAWTEAHDAYAKGLEVTCIHCHTTVPRAASASDYGFTSKGAWIGEGVCQTCQHAIDALPGAGNGMSDDDDHGPVMV